ncbi:MAG: DUF420 domain-containing protein [Planctomycetes bacterium]|nr:DUF420 domain-containing protein [Planctomycetota bacterium]
MLPTLNACLNATAAVLLVAGYRAIRRGDVRTHRRRMIAAFLVSIAFLTSYVTYHVTRQVHEGVGHTPFTGPAGLRPAYFALLISHLLLAIVTLPMVVVTLALALRGRFDRHRRLARWTWPIWMYVSVTGVIVYLMLYHV